MCQHSYKLAYDQFEGRIRVHSATNTRASGNLDPLKASAASKALSTITEAQMRRGAEGKFKWVTTLYPTDGYAQDAGMSLKEYEDFVFGAVHANEADPIAYWKSTGAAQQKAIDFLSSKDQVVLRGPNVDLTLSIKGRKFENSIGIYNMPDGEIFTGPVEDSVNGWVKFTYPAIYDGVAVEGAELTFSKGQSRVGQGREEPGLPAQDARDGPGLTLPGRVRDRHQQGHHALHRQHPVRREDRRLFPHGAGRRLPRDRDPGTSPRSTGT